MKKLVFSALALLSLSMPAIADLQVVKPYNDAREFFAARDYATQVCHEAITTLFDFQHGYENGVNATEAMEAMKNLPLGSKIYRNVIEVFVPLIYNEQEAASILMKHYKTPFPVVAANQFCYELHEAEAIKSGVINYFGAFR